MSDVTRILSQIESGDPSAAEKLLPLVYQELRKLAAARMAAEAADHTLQATALVHEAYLRLVGSNQPQQWNGRAHFFGAAAEAMRRILIGRARQKAALKAGGEWNRVELLSHELPDVRNEFDLIALDDTLQKLEVQDRRAANLVKLRFFGGLTMAEAAATLGVSVGTAENDWAYAKSWLKRQLRRSREGSRTN